MKRILLTAVFTLALAGAAYAAPGSTAPSIYQGSTGPLAVHSGGPTVSLHQANVGIGSMNYEVSGRTIRIWEDWSSNDLGFLRMRGLREDVNYRVELVVRNRTGKPWFDFGMELLDPSGHPNDNNDVATDGWVPNNFSHSNSLDELSFAAGIQGPPEIGRSSDNFRTVHSTDGNDAGHDRLLFTNGHVGAGDSDRMRFGIRDGRPGPNQPFLLAQRGNLNSPVVPEPTTMILFGLGLAGVALRKRLIK